MATNEWLDDILSDDEVECDLNYRHTIQPIRAKSENGFNYSQLTENGVEFETKEENNDEVENETFWTKEEIMKHMETNSRPDDIGEDGHCFEDRVLMMDTVVEDSVYKRVIVNGSGQVIKENSSILYNLSSFLEDQAEPFDSTWFSGKPYLHRLNYGNVLEGLRRGLLTMRGGEKCELVVKPNYAYLETGCPPKVPPNATILYIVEVLKIYEGESLSPFETLPFAENYNYSFDTFYQLCDIERISGNTYFKDKRLRESAFRYRRAIRVMEQMTYKSVEEVNKGRALLLKLYVNIGNAYNRMQKPFAAISNCKRALDIDKQNVKALYQLGLARMYNGEYDSANRILIQAQTLKPHNEVIKEALIKLDRMTKSDDTNGCKRSK